LDILGFYNQSEKAREEVALPLVFAPIFHQHHQQQRLRGALEREMISNYVLRELLVLRLLADCASGKGKRANIDFLVLKAVLRAGNSTL
jgi:hypothetical protein